MRRIVLWVASTVTVVVLMFGYHTSTNRGTSAGAVAPPSAASGSTSTSPSSSPSSRASTASAKASTKASTKASPSATAGGSTTTYTGDTAQTRWGPLQVTITVTNGKVSAVDVPTYPNGNHRDEEINSYALPTLVQETLSAQSAKIDMVSGATVTSEGYLQSLQSALDRAGI